MQRRTFLKSILTSGAATILVPSLSVARRFTPSAQYFSLHPFIDAHPEAVFILKTSVSAKTATAEKLTTGFDLARQIFTLSDTGGIPLSHMMAIKPNFTCTNGAADFVDGMGIRTDVPFLEGLIQGMKQVGFSAQNMFMRESNWMGDAYCPNDRLVGGVKEMAQRTGTNLFNFTSGRSIEQLSFDTLAEGTEVVWKDCPNGVVLRRIGYLAPFNRQDAWILNVAKFKAHGMGLTTCIKNLQGTVVNPLVSFCEGVDSTKARPPKIFTHFNPNIEQDIDKLYARHVSERYPRWDKPGRDTQSGYGMETWAQRTCDSHSVMSPGFHMIEGIYGRNGDGFSAGPGPGNKAQDFMSNVVIFGKDPFRVDIIGHWLGGHEPGNFGLFHIAKERGLLNVLNPKSIPVYSWENGSPKLTPLTDFARTPLVTKYIRRDYNGQTEAEYHLVDEPFDYGPTGTPEIPSRPSTAILKQNYSNPFRASTTIEYTLPSGSYAKLEVFDEAGDRIDLLVDGWQPAGTHMAAWDASRRSAGTYFYRFSANGWSATRKMIVIR